MGYYLKAARAMHGIAPTVCFEVSASRWPAGRVQGATTNSLRVLLFARDWLSERAFLVGASDLVATLQGFVDEHGAA